MILTGVFAVSNLLHGLRMMSIATEENFFVSITNVTLDMIGIFNAAAIANIIENGFVDDVSTSMYMWFMFFMVRDVAIMINLGMIGRDVIAGVKAASHGRVAEEKSDE